MILTLIHWFDVISLKTLCCVYNSILLDIMNCELLTDYASEIFSNIIYESRKIVMSRPEFLFTFERSLRMSKYDLRMSMIVLWQDWFSIFWFDSLWIRCWVKNVMQVKTCNGLSLRWIIVLRTIYWILSFPTNEHVTNTYRTLVQVWKLFLVSLKYIVKLIQACPKIQIIKLVWFFFLDLA